MIIHRVNHAFELGNDDIPCLNRKLPVPDLIFEFEFGCYRQVYIVENSLIPGKRIDEEKEKIIESIGDEVWVGDLDEFTAVWKTNPLD